MSKSSLVILIILIIPAKFAMALEVVSFDPIPKYRLTVDEDDQNQLVDGVDVKYPIWLYREAVGWGGVSPIRIVLSGSELKASSNKIIRIHSAVGRYAGVLPIIRVDAYRLATGLGRRSQHIGQYIKNKAHRLNREKYYIDIPIGKKVDKLGLVIHTEKGGLYLDEIEVLDADVDAYSSKDSGLLDTRDIVEDSSRRLEVQYQKAAAVVAALDSTGGHALGIGIIDCFEKDLGETLLSKEEYTVYSVDGLRLQGQLCLKVINNKRYSSLRLDSEIPFTAYEIQPQIIRGGIMVYDALASLKTKTMSVESKSVIYLLIDLEKAAFKQSSSEAIINVILDDIAQPLRLHLVKRNCQKMLNPMDFNVWAYTLNRPIWNERNKAALAGVLHDAGVNIHTIHPNYIPKLGSDWTADDRQALSSELKLFEDKVDQFLWVVDWSVKKKFLSLTASGDLSQLSKSNILSWLAEFNHFLVQERLSAEKMVLYPIDEPFGEKLVALKAIIAFLSEQGVNISIYANPSAARRGSASERDLLKMDVANIFWQPSWKYVQKNGADFFQRRTGHWMIYDNPAYPAKNASPAEFFRALPWKAWSVGADGVGTWSFDDTQGSSAYNDFDGRRSDWSLVYESDEVFTPSRRWIALLRGIEDIRLAPYWRSGESISSEIISAGITGSTMNRYFLNAMQSCGVD